MREMFDEVVEASWVLFEERLRERLRALPDGYLEIERAAAGPEDLPCMTVDWDEEQLEAELLGLSADHDFEVLEALGWHPPKRPEESPFWSVTMPFDEAEVLAGMVSGTLRYVFGIADPAFLAGVEARTVPQPPSHESCGPAEDADVDDGPRPTLIGFPDDAADLVRMVEQALEVAYGPDLVRDDDGDYPIGGGAVPIWVRVQESTPMVRVFSYVVRSVRDTRQARIEVGILNRRTPLLKFTLEDGVITATHELLAAPFVGPQLLNALDLITEVLNDLAGDAALRVGGKLWFDGIEDVAPSAGHEEPA